MELYLDREYSPSSFPAVQKKTCGVDKKKDFVLTYCTLAPLEEVRVSIWFWKCSVT